jgi:hypothetical protein
MSPDENRVIEEVTTLQTEPNRTLRIFTFKATELIWLLFGILEAAILLRVSLKLIGANAASPIVALIYGFTQLFLFPFTGMVSSPTAGYMELELSSLFAMLIYALVAWVLERIVWLVFYRPRETVVEMSKTQPHTH